jgi:hypothetical protein
VSSRSCSAYTSRFSHWPERWYREWKERRSADVVSSEAPNSKCTAEGSNARVRAFRTLHEHPIGGEGILLLAICLGLKVSDAAREEVGIHNFALAPAVLQFLFKLFLLESEPLSDLLRRKET